MNIYERLNRYNNLKFSGYNPYIIDICKMNNVKLNKEGILDNELCDIKLYHKVLVSNLIYDILITAGFIFFMTLSASFFLEFISLIFLKTSVYFILMLISIVFIHSIVNLSLLLFKELSIYRRIKNSETMQDYYDGLIERR